MLSNPAPFELVTTKMFLPTGCDPAIDPYDFHVFALYVRWFGPRTDSGRGGYGVTRVVREEQLSRAGNWGHPRPFQQHQYRWATMAEAEEAARGAIDAITVNGYTWAQQLKHAERRPG